VKEGQASSGRENFGLAGLKMAIRNTPYEDDKLRQLAESCPKLPAQLEKAKDDYVLTGSSDGVLIKVGRRSLTEAIRIYRAEYRRLESAGMLPAKAEAVRV
jgi:hypothetical protein